MSATRNTSEKSGGSTAAASSAQDGATSGGDNAQSVLNAASAPTALLFSLAVELQRLQSEAFSATTKALESAMQEASKVSQPQDLLRLQFEFVGAAMERAANYNREWFTRVAGAQSQLIGMAPHAASGAGGEAAGAGAAAAGMPGFSPADFLGRGPEAWSQLTRQWIESLTRGAMPR